MKTLDEIFVQFDYAYALLNQKVTIRYNGKEIKSDKPVTLEDVAKCKEVLRDSLGDLKMVIDGVKMTKAVADLVKVAVELDEIND